MNSDGTKPIYIQVSEWIETEILNGNFVSDEKVNSQYQLAEIFNINPATAAKGLTILVEENILYKRRGLGMFVAAEAKPLIIAKRKEQTLKRLVLELVLEATYLDVSESELIEMIQIANRKSKGEEQ